MKKQLIKKEGKGAMFSPNYSSLQMLAVNLRGKKWTISYGSPSDALFYC